MTDQSIDRKVMGSRIAGILRMFYDGVMRFFAPLDRKIFVGILATGTGFSPSLFAQLTFEEPVQHGQVQITDATLDFTFKFKNTGDSDVQIRHVASECDCIAQEPSRLLYKPGESGEIKVTYRARERYGDYEQKVTVFTSADPGRGGTDLVMKLTRPRLMEIDPYFLRWTAEGEAEAKTAEIYPSQALQNAMKKGGLPYPRVIAAKPNREFWRTELTAVEGKPGHYRVTVTPASAKSTRVGYVDLELVHPAAELHKLRIALAIARAETSGED